MREVEPILEFSTSGRQSISSIVGRVSCAIAPDAGYGEIMAVADNRAEVMARVAGVRSDLPEAREALAALRAAMQASYDADIGYAQWVQEATTWYYTYPVGCLGDPLPSTDGKVRGDASSGTASARKADFVRRYNGLAKIVGGKTWSDGQI